MNRYLRYALIVISPALAVVVLETSRDLPITNNMLIRTMLCLPFYSVFRYAFASVPR